MVKPEQLSYIKSQRELFDAILDEVQSRGRGKETALAVAQTLYLGYVISDIEDKLSVMSSDVEKIAHTLICP